MTCLPKGCNVTAQMVACIDRPDSDGGPRYSLSCNPDTGPELIALMRDAEARGERKVAVVAQVNRRLPFMFHDAEVAATTFDHVIDAPGLQHALFCAPKQPVSDADHAIGLHASTLLKDGGTLQIGIGQLGDAIVHSALARHQRNAGLSRRPQRFRHRHPLRRLAGPRGRQRALRTGSVRRQRNVRGRLFAPDAGRRAAPPGL